MAEKASSTNIPGAHSPDATNPREARYAARASLATDDDTPGFETILSDLTLHPTTPGSSPMGAGTTSAGPTINPEVFAQETSTLALNPGRYQGDPTALRERRAALKAHHEQLLLLAKESADLLLVLPPSPTPSSNPFDSTYGTTAATAATTAQSQPFAPHHGHPLRPPRCLGPPPPSLPKTKLGPQCPRHHYRPNPCQPPYPLGTGTRRRSALSPMTRSSSTLSSAGCRVHATRRPRMSR